MGGLGRTRGHGHGNFQQGCGIAHLHPQNQFPFLPCSLARCAFLSKRYQRQTNGTTFFALQSTGLGERAGTRLREHAPAARVSQEAIFTQPRAHFFAQHCTYLPFSAQGRGFIQGVEIEIEWEPTRYSFAHSRAGRRTKGKLQ